MKTKITLLITAFFVCLTITAQTKVGTVNSELIISKMPQLAKANETVESAKINVLADLSKFQQ